MTKEEDLVGEIRGKREHEGRCDDREVTSCNLDGKSRFKFIV